ncbi:MAG: helix-turn-helix domain-containing protein [Thermomicrobiales bacterium]
MQRRARSPEQGPIRQRIGPTIKALRLERSLSLNDLAEQAGISPSHLSRMERGLTVPSYDVLDRVADALGSDLRALRQEEEVARAVDAELHDILNRLGIAPSTQAELLRLTNPARNDLTDALKRVVR